MLTDTLNRFKLPEAAHYLTERATAELVGRSYRTLQGWRIKGLGPAWIRLGPRCIAYRFSDVQAWLEANRHQNAA